VKEQSNSAVEDATNVVESTQSQETKEVELNNSKKLKKNKQRRKKKKKSNNIENAQVTNDTTKNKTSDVEDSEKVEIESPITNLRHSQR